MSPSGPRPAPDSSPLRIPPLPERILEGTLFASRWLLAPFYLGLALSLFVLLYKFGQKAVALIGHLPDASGNEIIIGILSLIDLSFVGNLVLMVVFSGYENFVSRLDLDEHRDKPDWMGHVGFGDLKLKLMTSIVAISAIQVLESFMNMDQVPDRTLMWGIGIHMMFVVSAVLLAVMDRLLSAPAQK